jgi:mutator protein MutT
MAIFATARVLLVNSAKELLIVRRSATDPRHAGEWDIPGGRLEPGEDVMAAAVRETEEEIGVTAKNPELVFAMSKTRYGGTGTWIFFLERVQGKNPEITLSNEHDDYKWVPFAGLPEYTEAPVLLGMHDFLSTHDII